MSGRYPFLVSIPHGGVSVPPEVRSLVNLSREEIIFNSDPHTRLLYGFDNAVETLIDFDLSRIFVDTNRAPYDYPPRVQDGVVKVITQDGTPVFRKGRVPGRELIGLLLQNYYHPFHGRLARALDTLPIRIAFDCHSMLPRSPPVRMDVGRERPLFCLSNRGDRYGNPLKKGALVTCPPEWLQALARSFQAEFDGEGRVAMNDPFRGGFISVAHYRRTRIPWVQVEINRGLYETEDREVDEARLAGLRERIFAAFTGFWDEVSR
ncbi:MULTISPECIES: N-formylglutamate amidohydrolase [unclassified Methanoculleus]|uniref:N-formylglutamate amidohydrolase n=1 Tax=unclassified Methanoculleus TaxID=2619537 RepID=UPI0025E584E1|nr:MULTISPECIES: N-formylglutamate amidohydrolase [unclassified Methanoculleus]MCK9317084.1 N-formylglutamate amidohydrolase [Methanoculleus sp.]MDD2253425.1 N-formylglutamate amidohydrolase [Methanoculleus sp.]MDD2787169.1 N-formylglutamate amidohydrolase [Methanoculleus sp.]MDD3214996.1 N-formylglutamate amidohydrolase [Methanoculleus sp.]MDD4313970.1 N-formylglutamate amidohydrolase [Methanoculleus sp.]